MSVLITSAIGVGVTQSYLDAVGAIQQKEDLARMLNMVGEIAASSGDESLAALVESEGGEKVEIVPVEEPAEDAPAEEGAEDGAEDGAEEGTEGAEDGTEGAEGAEEAPAEDAAANQ